MPALTLLGPVMDEARAQPSSANGAAHASAPAAGTEAAAAASPAGGQVPPEAAGSHAAHCADGDAGGSRLGQGCHAPEPAGHVAAEGPAPSLQGVEHASQRGEGAAEVPNIGPQLGPHQVPREGCSDGVLEEQPDLASAEEAAEALEEGPAGELMGSEPVEVVEGAPPGQERARRVVGPAMPSAELLAAAAEAKEAVRAPLLADKTWHSIAHVTDLGHLPYYKSLPAWKNGVIH